MRAERSRSVLSIQALRAIAALAVVIGHTYFELAWFAFYQGKPNPLPEMLRQGAMGVDLFFVISGFVMVYSSDRFFGSAEGARTFAMRRLIRIVPLYWLATTFTLWYWRHIGATLAQQEMSRGCVAASYFFVPCLRENGVTMDPALGVGWTLNFEMFFYAVFAVAAMFPRRWAVVCAAGLLGLFVIGHPIWPSAALRWLSAPIILEFVFGMLVGLAASEKWPISRPVASVSLAVGIVSLAATVIFGLFPLSRVAFAGLPCMAIVAGAVFLGDKPGSGFARRGLYLIGDASYSLYLVHGAAMTAFRTEMLPLATWLAQWPWIYVAMMVALSVAAALLVFVMIERPVTVRLQTLVSRRHDAPQPVELLTEPGPDSVGTPS